MRYIKTLFMGFSAAALLAGCSADGNNQGREYAPNMYHSVAYEPYSQVTDWEAGRWATSIDYEVEGQDKKVHDHGHAEYFNSNMINKVRTENGTPMNMRMPPAHTVSRNSHGWLPYLLPNDSTGLRLADKLVNPLTDSAASVAQGKILYETYCDHCHGAKGKGDGKVAEGVKVDGLEKKSYAGVANLTGDALKNITEGHIFHVITYGKGLMMSHGSQVSPEDRWKIARYVKTLQK